MDKTGWTSGALGKIRPVSGIADVVSIECDGFIRWNHLMNQEDSIFTTFIFISGVQGDIADVVTLS